MVVSSNISKKNSRDLSREEPNCDDEIDSPIDDDDKEFPTTSIRVLLVDSDPKSSSLMSNLMTEFSYQVRVFNNGDEAIAFLMKSKHEVDLVIWDFHVPEINGLEALNTIHKDMDLPIVIMSHDNKKETVMKSTEYGACNFLVKPVSKEVTAVLWQHVYRKRMSKSGLDSVISDPEEDGPGLGQQDNNDLSQSNDEEGSKTVVEDSEEQNTSVQKGHKCKKQRMTWTPELHQNFENAVLKIGSVEKAVPKQILKEMNVPGLTRNNVASHLQKFRQNFEKRFSIPQVTRQDSGWRTAGPNTALTASKPLLNPNFNLHARAPYFTNDQALATAPMQYPSTSYTTINNSLFMNNCLANLTYPDSFHQPQQQQYQHQPYYHSNSLQLPSVITKQESAPVSAAMDSPDLITNQNPSLFDYSEYFPPGLSDFDPFNRF